MPLIHREFHYHWEWRLQSSPEALWPLVADTNRFNQDTGLPPVERVAGEGLRQARRHLWFSRLGVRVEWVEEPFEWVEPHTFGVVRRYRCGPVEQMRVLVELRPEGAGTRLVYQVWARPENVLGLAAIPVQIGVLSRRSFAAAIRQYDTRASRSRAALAELSRSGQVEFSPGGQRRLAARRQDLLQEGAPAGLVDRLVAVVETGDSTSVHRLQPYALADEWGARRREVLELCLLATRIGLLEFEWDLLCPLCRGAKARSTSLGGVEPQVHCDTCNIDFAANFERSVELTFHPNPAVRPLERGEYCIAGPRVTPHVAVQQLLAPGETRQVAPILGLGRYRLRALELRGGQFLEVAQGGAEEVVLAAREEEWPDEELHLAPQPVLRLENATAGEQLLILERMAWTDQAATAAEVTALQRFRDLFSGEALRPGERISVGSLAVLFTDLCGSTRLYRQVGDAPAFGLVMDHFDVLLKAIADEDGALVKTIGDAVMAVFRRPVSGVRAIQRAQRELAAAPGEVRTLRLKAGMHYGPCIAVTLNERLDYFGSTVNLASRLEHLSEGGDLVVSAQVYQDPEVADLMAAGAGQLQAEPLETGIKGFEERFALWRLRPGAGGAPADGSPPPG